MSDRLDGLLRATARRVPDKLALVTPDTSLGYAALDDLADRAAARLAAIPAGAVVSLWIENGWRWVAAYYGALRAGLTVNPLNALLTPAEVEWIAGDCGAAAVLTSSARAETLDPALPRLVLDDLSDWPTAPAAAIAPAPIASIGYTSGTTGFPKGARLGHAAILLNARMTALMHGRTPADVGLSALPCPHVYGNVVLHAAILTGATLVLFPRFDAEEMLAAIARHRATVIDGVPTMYCYMLESPGPDLAASKSLRVATVGGQSMPVPQMEAVEARFGCPLIELWGMTELGGLGTTHPHTGPRSLGAIGVPLPFLEARIADPAAPDDPLDDGAEGELQIRGPAVMEGYHNRLEATAEAIRPGGWLRSGDIALRDVTGAYRIVDRAKDVILSGGYNVYPAELERVIAAHPAVAMVAVAAMPDPARGEAPKAFIVPRAGAEACEASILEHCRRQLAAYKLPRAIAFVADLPKTSTGKILRRALKETA